MKVRVSLEEVNDDLNSIKSCLDHIENPGPKRVIERVVERMEKRFDKALEIRLARDRIEKTLANVESEEDYDEVISMIDEAKSTYGHQPQFARLESKAHTLRSLAEDVPEDDD